MKNKIVEQMQHESFRQLIVIAVSPLESRLRNFETFAAYKRRALSGLGALPQEEGMVVRIVRPADLADGMKALPQELRELIEARIQAKIARLITNTEPMPEATEDELKAEYELRRSHLRNLKEAVATPDAWKVALLSAGEAAIVICVVAAAAVIIYECAEDQGPLPPTTGTTTTSPKVEVCKEIEVEEKGEECVEEARKALSSE